MKYKRAEVDYKIEDQPKGKIRLTDDDDFTETPWVAKPKGQDHVVLLNHALLFLPFHSWGVIIPTTGSEFDVTPLQEKQELLLHPEAYDAYLENQIIDKDGNYIAQPEEETEEEEEQS